MAGALAVTMPMAGASPRTDSAEYWEGQMRLLLTLRVQSYAIGNRKVTRDEAVIYVFERWQRAIRENQNAEVRHARSPDSGWVTSVGGPDESRRSSER
jgi:hypothetical protein